jgi:hypothetical protein
MTPRDNGRRIVSTVGPHTDRRWRRFVASSSLGCRRAARTNWRAWLPGLRGVPETGIEQQRRRHSK